MIQYLKGDVTQDSQPGPKILVHSCNNVGAFGRGIALAIANKWPEVKASYLAWYQSNRDFVLGAVQLVEVKPDFWVANLIGQEGLRSKINPRPANLQAVELGLQTVAEEAEVRKAKVIMPRICTHLGGRTWAEVQPIVERTLKGLEVFVYDLA